MNITVWILLIAAFILLLLFIYKESTGFRITEYHYEIHKLKRKRFVIAFLSDLHDSDFGNQNQDILKAIDEMQPNAVMFGGDMVTSCMERKYDYESTLQLIEKIAKKYPVYYGMGNHEERFRRRPEDFPGKYVDLTSRLKKMGAPLMVNEMKQIKDAGIDVYGLDLPHKYYHRFTTRHIEEDYLKRIFGEPDRNHVSILLAHNPEHFKQYAKWGCDFVLSGHVHGGIMSIPFLGGLISPAMKIFPKYDAGEFREGTATMILSRGIGSHTVPIRVFNKAEIIKIVLENHNWRE